jgi:N-acetylglutamate synthase
MISRASFAIDIIEKAAFHAWPASETFDLDGWQLRFHHGVTRRANSVWPNRDRHTLGLPEKLASVESWYAARGQPACYQIAPIARPTALDAALAERGYLRHAPTLVQVAPAAGVLARSAGGTHRDVLLDDSPGQAWLEAYAAAEAIPPSEVLPRRDILCRIRMPAAFAAVEWGGQLMAVGLGVLDGQCLGIFNLATRPAFRRQGAARAIISGLAAWATSRGAATLYLQVMERNMPARTLYASLGFTTLYTYHYRSP